MGVVSLDEVLSQEVNSQYTVQAKQQAQGKSSDSIAFICRLIDSTALSSQNYKIRPRGCTHFGDVVAWQIESPNATDEVPKFHQNSQQSALNGCAKLPEAVTSSSFALSGACNETGDPSRSLDLPLDEALRITKPPNLTSFAFVTSSDK